MKVRNLKANHNFCLYRISEKLAVLASVKVRNLKANHNIQVNMTARERAVLASVKVRNLKANHNRVPCHCHRAGSCISKCEGTESES